jgi:GTP pyrophosphokinase
MRILTKKNPDLLMEKIHYLSRSQKGMVKKALLLAEDAHKFQKRLSGEPYVIHPFNVALILADLGLDYETICAGLLHDILEDTIIEESYIRKEFGDSTTNLVKAVTNISALKNQSKVKIEAENMRRLILETVKDPRVILVKLADKLHNLRTLEHQPLKKARKIAREALDIYAPLAGRLGIYKIKFEIEDICLLFLHRKIYYNIRKIISEKKSNRDRRIKAIASILSQTMKEQKIKCQVEGRSKHFYSIYQKMKSKDKDYLEIYDLTGLRILVDNIQDCYKTLGVIHTMWRPIPGRFKDYISVPKSNGYQSLHTTVIGNGGKAVEFQIRTWQMHTISEIGIAAHWMYKGGKRLSSPGFGNIFQNITDLNADRQNSIGFIRDLKDSLVDAEIYTFTPKGEIITLPNNSTVLDFAFQIHTDLGIHCAGAEIDSRFVSIRTPLRNGTQVKIISNSSITPSKSWLHIVKSSHARSKLRSWLKKHQKSTTKKTENKAGSHKHEEDHSTGLHMGEMVLIRSPSKLNYHGVVFQRALCCQPSPGDDIIGVFNVNNQLWVHRKNCVELGDILISDDKKKNSVELIWNEDGGPLTCELKVTALNEPDVLMEIVRIFLLTGSHVINIHMESTPDSGVDSYRKKYMNGTVQLECENIKMLRSTMDLLKRYDSVEKIQYKILHFGRHNVHTVNEL